MPPTACKLGPGEGDVLSAISRSGLRVREGVGEGGSADRETCVLPDESPVCWAYVSPVC